MATATTRENAQPRLEKALKMTDENARRIAARTAIAQGADVQKALAHALRDVEAGEDATTAIAGALEAGADPTAPIDGRESCALTALCRAPRAHSAPAIGAIMAHGTDPLRILPPGLSAAETLARAPTDEQIPHMAAALGADADKRPEIADTILGEGAWAATLTPAHLDAVNALGQNLSGSAERARATLGHHPCEAFGAKLKPEHGATASAVLGALVNAEPDPGKRGALALRTINALARRHTQVRTTTAEQAIAKVIRPMADMAHRLCLTDLASSVVDLALEAGDRPSAMAEAIRSTIGRGDTAAAILSHVRADGTARTTAHRLARTPAGRSVLAATSQTPWHTRDASGTDVVGAGVNAIIEARGAQAARPVRGWLMHAERRTAERDRGRAAGTALTERLAERDIDQDGEEESPHQWHDGREPDRAARAWRLVDNDSATRLDARALCAKGLVVRLWSNSALRIEREAAPPIDLEWGEARTEAIAVDERLERATFEIDVDGAQWRLAWLAERPGRERDWTQFAILEGPTEQLAALCPGRFGREGEGRPTHSAIKTLEALGACSLGTHRPTPQRPLGLTTPEAVAITAALEGARAANDRHSLEAAERTLSGRHAELADTEDAPWSERALARALSAHTEGWSHDVTKQMSPSGRWRGERATLARYARGLIEEREPPLDEDRAMDIIADAERAARAAAPVEVSPGTREVRASHDQAVAECAHEQHLDRTIVRALSSDNAASATLEHAVRNRVLTLGGAALEASAEHTVAAAREALHIGRGNPGAGDERWRAPLIAALDAREAGTVNSVDANAFESARAQAGASNAPHAVREALNRGLAAAATHLGIERSRNAPAAPERA